MFHFLDVSEWRTPELIHFHSMEWSEISCGGRCGSCGSVDTRELRNLVRPFLCLLQPAPLWQCQFEPLHLPIRCHCSNPTSQLILLLTVKRHVETWPCRCWRTRSKSFQDWFDKSWMAIEGDTVEDHRQAGDLEADAVVALHLLRGVSVKCPLQGHRRAVKCPLQGHRQGHHRQELPDWNRMEKIADCNWNESSTLCCMKMTGLRIAGTLMKRF